jgi:hypothetical protein
MGLAATTINEISKASVPSSVIRNALAELYQQCKKKVELHVRYRNPEAVHGFRMCKHALHIRTPIEKFNFTKYYNIPRDFGAGDPFWHLKRKDIKHCLDRFINSERKSSNQFDGYSQTEGGTLTAHPSIKGFAKISEERIAAGLLLFNRLLPQDDIFWTYGHAQPGLYLNFVARELRNKTFESPARWVAEHMQIVVGLLNEIVGGDTAPIAAEYPYCRMAEMVCNTLPESLRGARRYQLSSDQKEILSYARTALGEKLTPDVSIIIVENPKINSESFKNAAVIDFFKNLSKFVTNGFNIDRFKVACEKLEISEAAKIVSAIYGGENRPWWFKQDFDLRGSLPGELQVKIAEKGGWAYEDTLKVLNSSGHTLLHFPGLSEEVSLDACVEITKGYGIGNPKRAINVINYVLETLSEAGLDKREKLLSLLLESIQRHKPVSPSISILEGEDINFTKPGITAALMSFDIEKVTKGKYRVDDLTFTAADVRGIAQHYDAPLQLRAMARLGISVERTEAVPLLTEYGREKRLKLTADDLWKKPAEAPAPLTRWANFEKQLYSECRHSRDQVAKIYFGFCAPRMPDPLSPPNGFLAAIGKFDLIRNPRVEHVCLVDPRERGKTEKENKNHIIDRYALITDLLDSMVCGLVTMEDVTSTLKWLTEEPQRELDRITKEALYREYEEWGSNYDFENRELAEYISEREKEIAALEKEGFDPTHSLSILMLREEIREYTEQVKENTERRMEWDDERVSDRISSDCWSVISEWQQSRVLAFEQAMDAIRALHIMVNSEILEAGKISNYAVLILEQLKAGKIPPLDPEEPAAPRLSKTEAAQLQYGFYSKMLSTEALLKRIEGLSDGADLVKFCHELRKLPNAILRVKELMEERNRENNWEINRRQSVLPELNPVMDDFHRIAKEVVTTNSLLVREDVEQYMTEGLWIVRLQKAEQAVQKLKEDINLEIVPGKPYNHNVTAVNHRMFDVFTASMVLNQIDQSIDPRADQKLLQDNSAGSLAFFSVVNANVDFSGIEEKVSNFRNSVLEARRESFGLLPIGGKIHVLHPIDPDKFYYLRDRVLGLTSTQFMLQHANKSMILPPAPSWGEYAVLINFLVKENIIDWDHPELHLACPGRICPKDSAVLGSSLLLATEVGVRYSVESFSTTSNFDTGFRIMLYDKGGERSQFPFDTILPGRTDMLGRACYSDMRLYQLLHTVLVHMKTGGPFSELGAEYCIRYREILNAHGLSSVLDASWIHEGGYTDENAGILHYEEAIKPCTDAWFSCDEESEKKGEVTGVIRDVRALFDWLQSEISKIQEKMLSGKNYSHEKELLLSF